MITGTPTNSKMPQTFRAKGSAVGQQVQTAYTVLNLTSYKI